MSCLQKVAHEIKVSTVNAMRLCTCGVTGWELNLDHILYFRFWLVPFYLKVSYVVVQRASPWKRTNRWCRRNRKNVTFRKVKSSQVVICSPQGFSEAVKTFVPAIYAVYLPESEKIIEPKGIESSRKSNETLKIHKLERKVHPNGNTYINFYKIADDEEPFHVKWYGSEDDEICGHERSSNNENQCPK